MAIYVPQWDPWAGIREGILQVALGYARGLEKRDQASQIADLISKLPGLKVQQVLSPVSTYGAGGTPMPGVGVSPSGGVDVGTPAAPAVVAQVPEPFDLKSVMSGIKDPGMALSLLPNMLNYDYEMRKLSAMENLQRIKEQAEEMRAANEPVKITAWKQRGGKYEPVTITVRRAEVPVVEQRLQEKGYYIGETPKEVPQGPETWSGPYRDPVTGRFVQRSSHGKISDIGGAEDTTTRELLNANRRIEMLKKANEADLEPYRIKESSPFALEQPDNPYIRLRAAALAPGPMTPEKKRAIERLKRVERRLEEIKRLSETGSTESRPVGRLVPNGDGTYTWRE